MFRFSLQFLAYDTESEREAGVEIMCTFLFIHPYGGRCDRRWRGLSFLRIGCICQFFGVC